MLKFATQCPGKFCSLFLYDSKLLLNYFEKNVITITHQKGKRKNMSYNLLRSFLELIMRVAIKLLAQIVRIQFHLTIFFEEC